MFTADVNIEARMNVRIILIWYIDSVVPLKQDMNAKLPVNQQ